MSDKENQIIEQRTIQATRKGYMGASGKLGVIVKHLGQPITVQSEGSGDWHNVNYLEGYYDVEDDPFWDGKAESYQNKIPYADFWRKELPFSADLAQQEEPTGDAWKKERDYQRNLIRCSDIGWYFYGLSSGINLEITYKIEENEILVKYDGITVYKETAGDLEYFVPDESWESKIKILYEKAKKIEKTVAIKEKNERISESRKNKEGWLHEMRNRWGL